MWLCRDERWGRGGEENHGRRGHGVGRAFLGFCPRTWCAMVTGVDKVEGHGFRATSPQRRARAWISTR